MNASINQCEHAFERPDTMKRSIAPLKSWIAFTAIAIVSSVSTPEAYGQHGIILNPGEQYVPGSLRDQFGNPIHDVYIVPSTNQRPQTQRPPIQRPDFTNPTIFDSQFQNEGVVVDPYTGHVIVNVGRDRMKESVLDPNRHIVDPGSLQIIDDYQRDEYGTLWHVTGRLWTSYGTPHSEIRRSRTSVAGGLTQNLSDRVETRIEEEVLAVPQVDGMGRPIQPSRPQPQLNSNSGRGHIMDLFK
jgi:hypothetical protein